MSDINDENEMEVYNYKLLTEQKHRKLIFSKFNENQEYQGIIYHKMIYVKNLFNEL